MNGYYFLILTYTNGRISIRDRPYYTYSAAEQARLRRLKKPGVKEISINYQYGMADDLSALAVKLWKHL